MKKEFIINKLNYVDHKEIDEFIKDILIYLEQIDQDEYEMNQVLVGIKHLFQGCVVKV